MAGASEFASPVPRTDEMASAKGSELKTPKANYSWPVVGDTYGALTDIYTLLRKRTDELGPVCVISQLGEKTVLLRNPATMRKLLQKEHLLVESRWPYTIKTMMGPGALGTLQFDDHTKMRRLLAPAFSPKAVAALVPKMVDVITCGLESWVAKGSFKAMDETKSLSFQIATEVILGMGDAWQEPEMAAKLRTAFDAYVEAFFAVVPLNIPGTTWAKGLQGKEYLIEVVSKRIRQVREDNKSTRQAISTLSAGHQIALLKDDDDKFLEIGPAANLLIATWWAAHDTLAGTLATMLRSLKGSPEAVGKLREEQKQALIPAQPSESRNTIQVVAQHGPGLTADVLHRMPYLEACMKECMRIDPAVVGLWRTALEDLDVDGYRVAKGSVIGIYTGWAMKELDERWVDQSDESALSNFYPERWLTEEGKNKPGWMPFGQGVRFCLGYTFAQAEIKIFLALLARHYDWDCNSSEPLVLMPLCHPKLGLPTRFWRLEQ